MDVARARRAASERALDAARVKLASTSRDIRRRALRALVVANVTGACDASLTARDSEVLRTLLSMYDDAEETFDERAREAEEGAAGRRAGGDAATCARWSPVTFLTWLCEREPVAIAWLEELGARERVVALMRDERRSEDGRAYARLVEAMDAPKPPRADDFDRDDEDAIGGYDAIREVRARRARERSQSEATTSEATFGEDDSASASRSSFAARERDATSADGDEGYALPHAAVSEEDAQYLYALTTMLDSCAHHALALGGLRELRCALADVPVEAVARVACRALERACELLSARDPRLSSPETRKEALGVIAQCAMALHRELVDASRGALSAERKARPPSPNSPITESHLDDERRRHGPRTRVLPMAHEFMTRAIPAMADPALRADAIRTIRLLLPLIQVVPSDGENAHGASLRRLSQYFDLCESALASVAFEPGAASEYLACVQASAEIAAVAGGARVRGVGAANASLFKRWYDVCVDDVLAAANPLAREYCARALRLACPTLAAELTLVRETDACLRFVTDAAQSGASAREFARAMTHTSRALTIVGTVADVRPLASRLVAALVASASAEGEAEDEGDARAEALLSLMTHDLEDVRATAYATLAASCAVDVLKHPLILSEIIVGGAHHVSTVRDAATCLQTLCARSSGDAAVAAHLSMHAAWLDAMSDDVDLGDAAMRARAFVAEANVGGRLGRLSTALRGLFHQDEKTRVRCATDLAHDIGQGVTSAADVLLRSTNDPFDDVLLEDDAYVRNRDDVDDSPRVDAFRESLRSRTFDDVRASIRAFIDHDDESETKQSVEELVAELEITVRDERLAAALADPRTLDALIRVALEQGSHVTVVTGAIQILAEATGACRLVRDALSREDGRGGRIAQLLGLAFHPRRRIRAATASLLTRFLFTPVADAVASRVGAPRPRELSLPKLFLETYRFPNFVPELKNPPSNGDSDAFAEEDVDVARVLAMFRRRQVLTHTYADANTEDEALLAFALDDAREDEPEEMRIARDSARMSCPPFVVGERVEALGDARSHEDAARALEGLHTIAHQSRTHAMAVLASLGRWNEASERFLRRPPRSPADARLWSLTADALATCLHSFARVDHAVLPSGSMKTLIQIARDVIVPLASVGAPMGGDAETDVVEDPPALRHPIAAARALGDDGGARCAARADAVRASMELLTCVCDAARRFRERSARDEDIAASLVELDVVATITQSLLSAKNCDNAARCAAVDASIAAFRLGDVPADTVRAFARATLDRVLSSSKRPGAALADKATRALVFIIERIPSHSWADAFYERDDLEWVRVALRDPWPRRRARAFETLAAAVGPGSPIADVVAVTFPDVFDLAVERALDEREAPKTRVEAFRCVASLVAGSAAAESTVDVRDDGLYRGAAAAASSSTPFPSLPMLAATDVWRAFARVLTRETDPNDHRAAMLRRGASAALLAAARVDALGVAEAFDFNPNHEADGTMWHGAFGVLRAPSRDDDVVADDAHAAANVASLLGVVTAAGCKTMDVALAADALRRRFDAAVDAARVSTSDAAVSRAASTCAEALATVLQANSRGDGDGERDIDATTMTGAASTLSRALAAAARADASRERRRSATGACLLVATAFRSPETATRATRGAFEHAGASIAGSLLALWRARLVGGAAVREDAPPASALVAAIRNVFAHDLSAKAAACEWGVVESLIETTLEAVRRSMNADGSFARAPTAMDVFVAASASRTARRRDALAAALEFGVGVDGRELPSTVALGSLTCLRHLMYASPRRGNDEDEESSRWLEEIACEIRERAADAGVVAMFRATWPYAGMDQTIAYELLSTVVNFVAKDADAKRALTTATSSAADGDGSTKSFAQTLMDFAFDSKHEPGSSTLELALKALSSLATVEGPARYWLLRSAFVDETATTLAHALVKARAHDDGERNATRARWMRTVHAAVRALCNVASFDDGQRAVLRASAGSHALELCLEVVAEARDADDVDARREAFLLMHNLAFHGGAKSHYVAHPNAIDCLVHAVGDDDARCATSACAALFALSRHGQRVVATLRERGRDAALRAAAKSRRATVAAENGTGGDLHHWSKCLRGVLFVLSADENDEAYADV